MAAANMDTGVGGLAIGLGNQGKWHIHIVTYTQHFNKLLCPCSIKHIFAMYYSWRRRDEIKPVYTIHFSSYDSLWNKRRAISNTHRKRIKQATKNERTKQRRNGNNETKVAKLNLYK